jgi:hypothetical protein
MPYEPMHRWWSAIVDLPDEAQRALVQWPPSERPLLAYRGDSSRQTPLLELAWSQTEERRAWCAPCDAGLCFRAGSAMDEGGSRAKRPRWSRRRRLSRALVLRCGLRCRGE